VSWALTKSLPSEGKFVNRFELRESLGMSLEGDCHKLEVTPNLEFLVTFSMSLVRVCQELNAPFYFKLIPNLE
jgi:hypothetical protein